MKDEPFEPFNIPNIDEAIEPSRKRILELATPFPVFNLDESIDFTELPEEMIIDQFELATRIFSLGNIQLQIRLYKEEGYDFFSWVVESQPDAFQNYRPDARMRRNDHNYNPFFDERAAKMLRSLRLVGTEPRYRFKYHTLHTQPFKSQPEEKELYEGRIRFPSRLIDGKPPAWNSEQYNNYFKRKTWAMIYYHNEENPEND
ncbi:MAG: hypothetical protein HYV38_00015, partial [Candidatus Levybacteria bacterium]|nr:hypothetical protein [Candidatus Levybacteria bacterium]